MLNGDELRAIPGPILILGASGFVGNNLLRALLGARNDVYGTTFSGASWRLKNIPEGNIVFFNTLDSADVQSNLHRIAPRTILDCSSFGAYSFEQDIERIHRTNYLALLNLLEQLKGLQSLHAYIHAGSSSEYGTNVSGVAEDAVLLPNSQYAVSKAAASLAISYYGKTLGLPVVNLRLFSVYGPYEDSSRLLPVVCKSAMEGELPEFANPNVARDFIHVDDVCNAFFCIARKMCNDFNGESFNVGTGVETTLEDLSKLIKKEFSIEREPVFSQRAGRAWDVSSWYADIGKIENAIGWQPRISLSEGLQKTYVWWQNHLRENAFSTLTKKVVEENEKSSISAIVACYKDVQAIPVMYQRLKDVFIRLKIDYEIIFVNDCSPDDSEEQIRIISAQDPRVIGITHSRNFGSQAAFRSGMEISTKEACVLLDGDLQDPPELIEEFVKEWRLGNDVVYGRRVKREMPLVLEWCYKTFYRDQPP